MAKPIAHKVSSGARLASCLGRIYPDGPSSVINHKCRMTRFHLSRLGVCHSSSRRPAVVRASF